MDRPSVSMIFKYPLIFQDFGALGKERVDDVFLQLGEALASTGSGRKVLILGQMARIRIRSCENPASLFVGLGPGFFLDLELSWQVLPDRMGEDTGIQGEFFQTGKFEQDIPEIEAGTAQIETL